MVIALAVIWRTRSRAPGPSALTVDPWAAATLEMTGSPDEVIRHEPTRCAGCGNGLSGAAAVRTERRQVVDLPGEVAARITEHQVISRRCSCGTVTAGTAPVALSRGLRRRRRTGWSARSWDVWHRGL